MSMAREPITCPERPQMYQIEVEGCLDGRWADWFDGVTITPTNGGETILTTRPVDQAALFGLLKKVRDLGLPLLAVNRVGSEFDKEAICEGEK